MSDLGSINIRSSGQYHTIFTTYKFNNCIIFCSPFYSILWYYWTQQHWLLWISGLTWMLKSSNF